MGSRRAEEARGRGEVCSSLHLAVPCHFSLACALLTRRKHRKGLWGAKRFEHPADYKKRMKAAEEGEGGEVLRRKRKVGLWRRIKRWFGAK